MIFVAYEYALTITSNGKVDCENDMINNVYYVPHLSAKLLSIPR